MIKIIGASGIQETRFLDLLIKNNKEFRIIEKNPSPFSVDIPKFEYNIRNREELPMQLIGSEHIVLFSAELIDEIVILH
jgi:hypothetical protein